MSRTIHMCISVRGMLKWGTTETRRNLRNIKKNDGTLFASVDEFRESLIDELAKGHEVLPLGPACEGFDYKTGCPGHGEPTP